MMNLGQQVYKASSLPTDKLFTLQHSWLQVIFLSLYFLKTIPNYFFMLLIKLDFHILQSRFDHTKFLSLFCANIEL